MLSKIFQKLVDLSPKLSFLGWKYFYETTAYLFKKTVSLKFMNYGYADMETTSISYDTLCGNLYRHLLNQIELNPTKDALEVGCGRGGGCELMLAYQLKSVTGVDFSKNVIKFCQKNYTDRRLKFSVGNAEQLPFEDEKFDVVINVESSHCYGNRITFFKEVERVLKPSGYFLYTDFMTRAHYFKRPIQLKDCGFEVLATNEINPQVLRSMQLSSEYKETLLKKIVIKPFRKAISDFAGLTGSTTYNRFASGETVYFSMVCIKKK